MIKEKKLGSIIKMKPIKVKINKYYLDISKDDEKEQYQKIKNICKELGHKLFDCVSSVGYEKNKSFFDNLPTSGIIETEFLFNNQYNVEKFRIHDWSETIFPNKCVKKGYFLTGDIKALSEAKDNRLQCGYCGKQYWRNKVNYSFCKSCINGEFLTKENLHLLKLEAVSFKGERSKTIPIELLMEFNEIEIILEKKRIERLKKKALKMRDDFEDKFKKAIYELSVKCFLLDSGISVEKLIYYEHSGEWCYGWSNSVTREEFEQFRDSLQGLDIPTDENGIDFVNLLKGSFL
jgi:hypothetical protein